MKYNSDPIPLETSRWSWNEIEGQNRKKSITMQERVEKKLPRLNNATSWEANDWEGKNAEDEVTSQEN